MTPSQSWSWPSQRSGCGVTAPSQVPLHLPSRHAGARGRGARAALVDDARAGVVLAVAQLGRARIDGGVVIVAVFGSGEAVAIGVAALEREHPRLRRDFTLRELRGDRPEDRDHRSSAAAAVPLGREGHRALAERSSGVDQRRQLRALPARLVGQAEVVGQSGLELERLRERPARRGLGDHHALDRTARAELQKDRGLAGLLAAARARGEREQEEAGEPGRGGEAHGRPILGAAHRGVKP
jgi:hypothetical protein